MIFHTLREPRIEVDIMTQGYCVKCKDKRYMLHEEPTVLKNGSNAIKGRCVKCGTGMFKMVGKAVVGGEEGVKV